MTTGLWPIAPRGRARGAAQSRVKYNSCEFGAGTRANPARIVFSRDHHREVLFPIRPRHAKNQKRLRFGRRGARVLACRFSPRFGARLDDVGRQARKIVAERRVCRDRLGTDHDLHGAWQIQHDADNNEFSLDGHGFSARRIAICRAGTVPHLADSRLRPHRETPRKDPDVWPRPLRNPISRPP